MTFIEPWGWAQFLVAVWMAAEAIWAIAKHGQPKRGSFAFYDGSAAAVWALLAVVLYFGGFWS